MYPPVRQLETPRLRRARSANAERPPAPAVAAPSRAKLALLTWAGGYTVITTLLWLLMPVIRSWPLPLRTLALSAAMFGLLTWVIMPRLTRLFGGWLARNG
jgi:uncharacterized protein